MPSESSVLPSRFRVMATILFHSTAAITVTLTSRRGLTIYDSPLCFLVGQYLVSIGLRLCVELFNGTLRNAQNKSIWRRLMPLAGARVLNVVSKTYCLAAVDASFYQLCRGLLLPFTLLLSYIFLFPRPTYNRIAISGVAIVILGFLWSAITDGKLKGGTPVSGALWGIGSSMFTAIESVVVKKFMNGLDEEAGMMTIVLVTDVMVCMCLLPLALFSGEISRMLTFMANASIETVHSYTFMTFLTGCALFALTIATFLQISVTSPTTHMVVTAARGVAQSLLAIVILREKSVGSRYVGLLLIIAGSTVYAWGKDNAMQAKKKAAAQQAIGMTEKDDPLAREPLLMDDERKSPV